MRLEHELRAQSPQTERVELPEAEPAVQPGTPGTRSTERRSSVAFNFAAGRMEGGRIPETTYDKVPGVSFATTGYEVHDRRGNFVSWHDCVLDACDVLKRQVVHGKVVRCSDRVLLKVCKPVKGRL